jgi:cytochrome c oxidase subunit 4
MSREPGAAVIVRVWIALLAVTAVEVALAAAGARGGVMLALLLAMSLVKAALILGWFMHLRFERRSLGLALLPIALVVMLLLSFVFPDSLRLARLRDGAMQETSEHGATTH